MTDKEEVELLQGILDLTREVIALKDRVAYLESIRYIPPLFPPSPSNPFYTENPVKITCKAGTSGFDSGDLYGST